MSEGTSAVNGNAAAYLLTDMKKGRLTGVTLSTRRRNSKPLIFRLPLPRGITGEALAGATEP